MEFQKIANFLDTTSDDKDLPRFTKITKKWVKVYEKSEENYSEINKEIIIKTSMLRSDLCDFSDADIVMEGTVTLEGNNDANKQNKNLTFRNMHHLLTAFQKLMVYKLIVQKT